MSGSRGTIVAAVLAAVAGAGFLIGPGAFAWTQVREGFPGYWTSARLVLEGNWSPRVYDDAAFAAEVLDATDGRLGEIYRPNPPAATLLVLPTAGLELQDARRAWLVIGLGFVLATWWLLVGAIPPLQRPAVALAWLALVLAWQPLRLDIEMGQVYAPLLAFHALGVAGVAAATTRGHVAAGIAVGAAAIVKLSALPWLAVLALRGRYLVVAAAAVAGALLVVVTLGFAGPGGWSTFAATAWSDLTRDRPSLAVTAYQSTAGLLRHLLGPDPTWNTGAIANAPFVARAGGLIVGAWVLAVTVLMARRGRWDLGAGLAIAASVIALTVAQEYAYTLLIVPAAIAIARGLEMGASRLSWAWLGAAIALIAAPLPYRHPVLDEGWVALLAYPRVYGAWLLWGWLARELAGSRAEWAGRNAQPPSRP